MTDNDLEYYIRCCRELLEMLKEIKSLLEQIDFEYLAIKRKK